MALRIEDYGLIGDTQTVALVGKNGSIDWACFPRFDSGSCFGALLGNGKNGRWLIAPKDQPRNVQRWYRHDTLILETEFTTEEGVVRLTDFMPLRGEAPDIVRIVTGVRGRVRMTYELLPRFDYGLIVPWDRRAKDALRLVAGPDALIYRSSLTNSPETAGEFTIAEGDRASFILTWHPSYRPVAGESHAERALEQTERWWKQWASRCTYQGQWRDAVLRSLITLQALTYSPTGGLVAAPTTSLPEKIGSERNWDYRFCWLRDSTFTLYALMLAGYMEEATAWRDWLLRAVGGDVSQIQIMYGLAGERRIPETDASWLAGYEGSRPVRLGNAAENQRQLDVYGEVMDTFHQARRLGLPPEEGAWHFQQEMLAHLEEIWTKPDRGIWEMRGPEQHFTHSKVMAWVAFERGIRSVEQAGLPGDVQRWKAMRDKIRSEILSKGYSEKKKAFVQAFDSDKLDAATLLFPIVGFIPADDERMKTTVAAIERDLMDDGFVYRYHPDPKIEALQGSEGAFLACSFWLADNYILSGRKDDARRLFERLLEVRNDLGLLSEEYDVHDKRLVGNFPQAFSHVALVNTARNLEHTHAPVHHRR